jgi:hypothetical protein
MPWLMVLLKPLERCLFNGYLGHGALHTEIRLYDHIRLCWSLLERLTTSQHDGIHSNMEAELLLWERHQLEDDAFAELKVWRVAVPVRGSSHGYKYSLAYVVAGECVLRYDNEPGKGDHRHVSGGERPYSFTTPERLLSDFWLDVDERRRG